MSAKYVHGYSEYESSRLNSQAQTLVELLHGDTSYGSAQRVLEVGCGIGAQTVILAKNSPYSEITSIDISPESIELAKANAYAVGIKNVTFKVADIYDLDFEFETFDHIFICFVLEHLNYPLEALNVLLKYLRPGGSITAIEGDHGSTFFYPDSQFAQRTIQCLIDLQAQSGGDSCIGRKLYPLFENSGLKDITVLPKTVYVDSSRPDWEQGFTKKTFIDMVNGVKVQAVSQNMMTDQDWDRGIEDMLNTIGRGSFNYTFFKAVGIKSA